MPLCLGVKPEWTITRTHILSLFLFLRFPLSFDSNILYVLNFFYLSLAVDCLSATMIISLCICWLFHKSAPTHTSWAPSLYHDLTPMLRYFVNPCHNIPYHMYAPIMIQSIPNNFTHLQSFNTIHSFHCGTLGIDPALVFNPGKIFALLGNLRSLLWFCQQSSHKFWLLDIFLMNSWTMAKWHYATI